MHRQIIFMNIDQFYKKKLIFTLLVNGYVTFDTVNYNNGDKYVEITD